MIQTVLDEVERGTRRKEGQGGRSDEGSEKMKNLLKKMKNEKVARERIVDPAVLFQDVHVDYLMSTARKFTPGFTHWTDRRTERGMDRHTYGWTTN